MNLPKESDIERTIAAIRDSHPDMEELYMRGQCYNFFLVLRSIYGNVVDPWYNYIEGHVYSKIGRYWYDIRGKHMRVKNCEPLCHRSGHKPHRWGSGDRRRLVTQDKGE